MNPTVTIPTGGVVVPSGPTTTAGIGQFLSQLFEWTIIMSIVLAIIFIILAAFQYMLTENFSKKINLRGRIFEILTGLTIAMGAVFILTTINPDLLNVRFASFGGGTKIGVARDASLDQDYITGGSIHTPGSVSTGTPGQTGQVVGGNGGGHVGGISLNGEKRSYKNMHGQTINYIEGNTAAVSFQNQTWAAGTHSNFGGPNDKGVSATETGAITGENLRGLDPDTFYMAARWDYDKYSVSNIKKTLYKAYNPKTGKTVYNIRAVDWGPGHSTGRAFDFSPGVEKMLGATTDSAVIYVRPMP